MIPRIIHQTWKSSEIPRTFRDWQRSWIERNPGFSYRFWTDEDIEALVRSDFPHLWELYTSYSAPIARVDLGRYLILKRHGGIYADLDCECLRPIAPLIGTAPFVIASEPEDHLHLEAARTRGLTRLLAPSFLGSEPGHPFWDHLIPHLEEARHEKEVLDATGPFLLTRAYQDYSDPQGIRVLPAAQVHPFSEQDCDTGRMLDIEYWEAKTREAYVVHYWAGTWWRNGSAGGPLRLPRRVRATLAGEERSFSGRYAAEPPMISCLMVTGARAEPAQRAIACFAAQTHENRELLVADRTEGPELAGWLGGLGLREVRRLQPAGGHPPFASLIAGLAAHAKGALLCLWGGEDLHDPERLEIQWDVMRSAEAGGSILATPLLWSPPDRFLGIANARLWEGTLLWDPAAISADRKDGTPSPLGALLDAVRVAAIASPRLTIVTRIDGDAPDPAPAAELRALARIAYAGSRAEGVLRELAKRFPQEAAAALAASAGTGRAPPSRDDPSRSE